MDFDKYSKNYKEVVEESYAIKGLDHNFFNKVKVDLLIGLAKNQLALPRDAKILDLGCGVGETDALLIEDFSEITGVDVSKESIEQAIQKVNKVKFELYDGKSLPFEDESFDMVFTINVIHHIPPINLKDVLKEAKRILKPGGYLVVFEHNPYNPLTVKTVKNCSLDDDAVLITKPNLQKVMKNIGLALHNSGYILFFPFKQKVFRYLEKFMKRIPFGAQYYQIAKKEVL